MARTKTLLGATLFAVLLASAAQAAVTADQVWQSVQDFGASIGQKISAGGIVRTGTVLTVTDVTTQASDAETTVTGTIARIDFTEQGDGTVLVTLAPEYPLILKNKAPSGEPVEMRMTVRQTDLQIRVSGDAAEKIYDLAGPKVELTLDSVEAPDVPESFDFKVVTNGLKGTYRLAQTGSRTVASRINAENVTIDLNVAEPGSNGSFALNGRMDQVVSVSDTTLPGTGTVEGAVEDMAAALRSGLSSQARFTYGPSTFKIDVQDAGVARKASFTGTSGTLGFGIDQSRMSYALGLNEAQITVASPDFPVKEAQGAAQELSFSLAIPVSTSEVPQDFSMVNRIAGLTLSDSLWGLFDPGAVLPRDPITVVLDLAGKGRWLVDMFDINPDAPPQTAPGEISAVTLNSAQVTVAGADLRARGALTVDNSSTAPGAAMPTPVGTVDATLVGGNGLLDRLVELGLLPKDQAMGARMMLGLFARPGEGADTLTSTVEFKADGTIFANGQQIQ